MLSIHGSTLTFGSGCTDGEHTKIRASRSGCVLRELAVEVAREGRRDVQGDNGWPKCETMGRGASSETLVAEGRRELNGESGGGAEGRRVPRGESGGVNWKERGGGALPVPSWGVELSAPNMLLRLPALTVECDS